MTRPDGLCPPTAGRLLSIWRETEQEKNAMVRGLLCNAAVLAESCFFEGERLFDDPEAVLETMTAREMELLLKSLAGETALLSSGENSGFDTARFRTMRRERT